MANLKSKFMETYSILKSELLSDPAFEFTAESHQWLERAMDYNVPRGKLLRCMVVIESFMALKQGKEFTDEELFLATVLGWCIEWYQGCFLIFDDICDNSHTRRGQPCWYKVPKVGMIAINDGLIIRSQIFRILKNHFSDKQYYVELLDLFNEVEFQTVLGQMLDQTSINEGEKCLTRFTPSLYRRIAQYKTSSACYLCVACALVLSGENLKKHVVVKDIIVKMGIYFQVQDDYLDTFGDPKFIGKNGTDIEDFKCSWLIVKALELSNEEQTKILRENYGKSNIENVLKVKTLYKELNLQNVFEEYENKTYEDIMSSIEAHPSKPVQAMLKSFLLKIYKRQK